MGIKSIALVIIQGVKPLLWHIYTPDAIPLKPRAKSGVPGNDPNEWTRTVLYDSKTRQLFIPGFYVYSCLREAAKQVRKGRIRYQTRIASCLTIMEDRVMVEDRFLPEEIASDEKQPVYLDVRAVRNPVTKAMNIRYRVACGSGWKCSFRIIWDESLVDESTMKEILETAGSLVGIGNGRGIGMGRFDILKFEIIS